MGIDTRAHDIRFVEDNWASPALGAWGLGWEVWLDGLEITQFTYFQQSGGVTLDPPAVELTYGMERILMALQGVTHFKDIAYAPGISYGEVFGQNEYEMSRYYLDDADIETHRDLFDRYAGEATRLVDAGLPIPAHVNVLKMSHAFNVLDARGAVSTSDRASRLRPDAHPRTRGRRAVDRQARRSGQPARCRHTRRTCHGRGSSATGRDRAADRSVRDRHRGDAAGRSPRRSRSVRAATSCAPEPLRTWSMGTWPYTPLRAGSSPASRTVAAREADREVTVRGPKRSAAFDADGNPTKAALGFARANGIDVTELETIDVDGTSLRRPLPHRGRAPCSRSPRRRSLTRSPSACARARTCVGRTRNSPSPARSAGSSRCGAPT